MRILVLAVLAAGPAVSTFADGTTTAPPAPTAPGAPTAPVPPTHDPDAVKFMHNLQETIEKQTDADAIASIKQLVAYWKDPAVKDSTKAPMPGLVAWYARRKIPAVGTAGISGLADIGKGEGSKNLVIVLGDLLDRDPPTPQMTAAVFAALKRVADTDGTVIKTLLKLFNYKDDTIVAKAADTLGGYKDAKVELRKDLFEELLKTFEGLSSEAHSSAGKGTTPNKSAINKWGVVGGSVLSAMGQLSHQQFADMPAARKWLNEHHRDPDAWK
jgi:hypothetical protein